MPITAGSISIVRRINTGDYSHKEAKAEVHYTIEGTDDPNALMDAVRHQAVRQLAQALATVVTIKHTPEVIIDGLEQTEAVELSTVPVQSQKRHRRTRAEMAATQAAYSVSANGADVTEPSEEGIQALQPRNISQLADDPPEDWGPAVAEISDKELNAACNETNNRIKNKAAIQGIIQHFTDGAVASIPQAQRARFLAELQTL
jgi:hypothetical protein